MGKNTGIEWADHSFNGWIGCTKVGPGCDHCYAEAYAKRIAIAWGPGQPRRLTSVQTWRQPLAWNRAADAAGRRARVFAHSLSDVFDNDVPDAWRARLWDLMRATPWLDWLVVTKRIGNAARMLPADFSPTWPSLWLLATVTDQEEADRDIPKLLATPALVHGLSVEPMLGPIDLTAIDAHGRVECYTSDHQRGRLNSLTGWCWQEMKVGDRWEDVLAGDDGAHGTSRPEHPCIDWVICGGESGPGARPMHPDGPRSLRDQCRAAGVPFFFKQWGEWGPWDELASEIQEDLELRGRLHGAMHRIGKRAAGRTLDGRTWSDFPA